MEHMQIKNPKGVELKDIKVQFTQTSDCIDSTFTYPNGFVLRTIQTAGEITIQPSAPLIDNGDGTLSIPD